MGENKKNNHPVIDNCSFPDPSLIGKKAVHKKKTARTDERLQEKRRYVLRTFFFILSRRSITITVTEDCKLNKIN